MYRKSMSLSSSLSEECDASHASNCSTSSSGYSGGKSSASSVASILDRLKSPVPSELARKRKILTNPPPVGQKRSKGSAACVLLKSVSPQDCVKEFDGESLCVSAGKLFCRPVEKNFH